MKLSQKQTIRKGGTQSHWPKPWICENSLAVVSWRRRRSIL